MKKYIVLDTETTGLNYEEGHKIIEIGAVLLEDRNKSDNYFHTYLNPQRIIEEEAIKVHGITNEELEDKPLFDEVVSEFLEFVEGSTLVIHNAPFDLGFLNHELRLVKKNEINKDQVVDSLEIARGKFPGTSNSLDALCKRFNIDLSRRTKHNALLDCELLREVYINLLDAKEPKFVFSNETTDLDFKNRVNLTKKYCKKVIKPTVEELKLHSEFLKRDLKKNYF